MDPQEKVRSEDDGAKDFLSTKHPLSSSKEGIVYDCSFRERKINVGKRTLTTKAKMTHVN